MIVSVVTIRADFFKASRKHLQITDACGWLLQKNIKDQFSL